jgi:hypothetical protein
MDEIEEQLSGGKPGNQITDGLMRALKEVESSGNPRAINPESGATGAFQFMPATVKMLKKQGIDFNPFDEKESERAARTYLQMLRDKNGGDLNKALAQYGGHITKDPTNYINKIYARMEKNAAAPKSKAQPGDEIEQALLGKIEREPEPPAPPPLKLNQLSQFGSLGVPEGDLVRKAMKKYFAPKPAETAPAAAAPAEKPRPYSRPEDIPGNLPAVQYKAPSMTDRLLGIPEAALATVSGAVAGTVAAPVGLAREMISGVPKEKTAEQIIQAGTYAPRTESGQEYVTEIGKVAANLPAFLPSMGKTAPLSRTATAAEQALRDQFAAKAQAPRVEPGIGAPAATAPAVPAAGQPKPKVTYADLQAQLQQKQAAQAAKEAALTEFANAPTQRELQAVKAQQAQASVAPLAGAIAPPGSVGAAAVTDVSAINAAISQLSPQYQAQFRGVDPRQIDLRALESHLQADRLGLGLDFFTEGQSTQSPGALSFEMNERGKYPALSERFNQQDAKLKTAVDRLHDRAVQNEVGGSMYDHGVRQINEYQAIDNARNLDINQKYKALKDAAGGSFPIDAPQFVQNARNLLDENLKTEYLPDSFKKDLEKFASGQPLTFQKFEALRTNLAKDMRKADRADDGNTKYALSLVRQALEDLPLLQEAQGLKSIADQARNAARERFDALAADPAYDAAVNGAPPDTFMEKHVFSKTAPASQIQLMRDTFGEGSVGALNIESALINHLREKGGLVEKSNVNQATYNKTFKALEEKLNVGAKPETVEDLRVLGDVLYKTKAQPTGSFVNNSNTFVANLANESANKVAQGADVMLAAKGLPPLASKAVGWVGKRREEHKMKRRLEPLAGVKKRD